MGRHSDRRDTVGECRSIRGRVCRARMGTLGIRGRSVFHSRYLYRYVAAQRYLAYLLFSASGGSLAVRLCCGSIGGTDAGTRRYRVARHTVSIEGVEAVQPRSWPLELGVKQPTTALTSLAPCATHR